MLARFSRIGFVAALCCMSIRAAEAANIFWVSEAWPTYGIVDQGFVDLLVSAGHIVDERYDEDYSFLSPDLVEEMNSSDLVIVSRSLNSGNAQDPDGWNSITAPLFSMNTFTSRMRDGRWRWFETNDLYQNLTENLIAEDPSHPIFGGLSVVDMVDETIDPGDPGVSIMAITVAEAGNGTVLATNDDGLIWAAYWEAETEFYDVADQFAGGPRLFFGFGGDFPGAPGNNIGTPESDTIFLNAVNFMLGDVRPVLFAGDADQDFDFDQLDLVQVQIAAKYLTALAASWGEGDWDGAPGGSPGNPPTGNGLFDQLDIIAALNAGTYLTGPYAAVAAGGTAGDGQTSVVYDTATGELAVDTPAGTELTSINIDSAAGIFTGDAAQNLSGSFDNDADKGHLWQQLRFLELWQCHADRTVRGVHTERPDSCRFTPGRR